MNRVRKFMALQQGSNDHNGCAVGGAASYLTKERHGFLFSILNTFFIFHRYDGENK